ncbi:hypothetical protein [Haloferula helveola]
MASKSEPRRWRKPHFYWWTLANVIAACLAVLSWVLCLHVFGHPEIPKNYEILKKLGRQSPGVGFDLQEAPPGEAADPRALYRRYADLDEASTARLNRALMRNYLTSLGELGLIQYVEGDFKVTHVRRLDEGDLFSDGFAVRARAMVRPDEFTEAAPWPVTLDYLFPTRNSVAADWFQPGDTLHVAKVPNCAMLLHVDRDTSGDSPLVQLTVVPIATGEYQVGTNHRFTIIAPEELNPGCRFPVFPTEAAPEEP